MKELAVLNITTPALLFSAISLLLLAYTNKFLALASLIRELHKQFKMSEEKSILNQIKNLRLRIYLIKNMQFLGILSFFGCTGSMLLLFIGKVMLGEIVFAGSLLLLLASLAVSLWETKISVNALDIKLSDIENNFKS